MSNVTALREPQTGEKRRTFASLTRVAVVSLVVGLAIGGFGPSLMSRWFFQVPPPSEVDNLAIIGLPAKLSCEQVRDGFGGVSIKFSASRIPEAGSQLSTTSTMTGIMGPKKDITGEAVESSADGKTSRYRTDGTGTVEKGTTDLAIGDYAENRLRPVAEGCRKALFDVPGVAG